jgi:hypothetical protein
LEASLVLNALGSHVRRNTVGYIALFVALGGTSYAATGGNFILGQSNTAGAPTQLSSPTTTSAGAFKVSNTNSTTAGRGITAQGGAGGFGLWASGGNVSKNTAAIHGQSGAGNAVEGFSTANPSSGVYGQDNNTNSYGVAGHSDNGVAVVGDSSNGWAFQALGNATQVRDKGGFVKAMAWVDPGNVAGHPIQRCFSAGVSPSQATSGDCGITYSHLSTGKHRLNFGFQVTDRFFSVTSSRCASCIASADVVQPPTPDAVDVYTYGPNKTPSPDFVDSAFWIIVF